MDSMLHDATSIYITKNGTVIETVNMGTHFNVRVKDSSRELTDAEWIEYCTHYGIKRRQK